MPSREKHRLAVTPRFVCSAALVLVLVTIAGEAALAQVEAEGRLAVPSEEELAQGVGSLKSLFSEEYRKTEKGDEKARLANTMYLTTLLLRTAKDSEPSDARHFALLHEAVRLGTLCDDAKPAMEAIGLLAASYDVDGSEMAADLMEHFVDRSVSITAVRFAGRYVLMAASDATDKRRLDSAQRLLNAGLSMAKRIRDPQLRKSLTEFEPILTALIDQERRFAAAKRDLEADPNSSAANRTAALFHGLRLDDWTTASAFAAKAEDDELVRLVEWQSAEFETPADFLKPADGWYSYASGLDEAEKLQAHQLARGFYEHALPQLSGLEKKTVESRLESLMPTEGLALRLRNDSTQVQGPPQSVILDGLIQAFTFDEGTVTTIRESRKVNLRVTDTSRRGAAGIIERGQIVEGRHGNCLQFSGNGCLTFDDAHLPSGKRPRTVAFWMKAGPQLPARGVCFRYGTIGGHNDEFNLIIFEPKVRYERLRGTVTLIQPGADATPQVHVSSTRRVTDNGWHHIAVTSNSRESAIFIDGALNASGPVTKNTRLTGQAVIGNRLPNDDVHGFTGLIDDFLIFDRVLSTDEIQTLHEMPIDRGFVPAVAQGEEREIPSSDPAASAFWSLLKTRVREAEPFSEAASIEFDKQSYNQFAYDLDAPQTPEGTQIILCRVTSRSEGSEPASHLVVALIAPDGTLLGQMRAYPSVSVIYDSLSSVLRKDEEIGHLSTEDGDATQLLTWSQAKERISGK